MPKKLHTSKAIAFGATMVFIFFILFSPACNKFREPDGSTINDITINEIRPAHGPFGTIDTLIGRGFNKIPAPDSIKLNGKKLTILSKSDQQIIVQIPESANTGKINIWYDGKLFQSPVFKYDSTFFVVTIAGSATEKGAVDGLGAEARFNQPVGIALDHNGNVYVADADNNAIRKITPQGQVTTLAGKLTEERGFADGHGSSARFADPIGLRMGPDGYLYVADVLNERIRRVSLTGDVTTIAGFRWNGSPPGGQIDGDISIATFNQPVDVAVDANNNVYVADVLNNKIRKISNDIVSTYAGGDYYHFGGQDGPALTARFLHPSSIVADLTGNLFVIDGDGQWIRKITPDGIVSRILGPYRPNVMGSSDELLNAITLAMDKDGNLFFAFPYGVMKRTPEGKLTRYAIGGIGELDGRLPYASFRFIHAITVDDSGNIYLTDNNRVRKIYWK